MTNLLNGKVFVYILTFSNGKQYVGISRNPEYRLTDHFKNSRSVKYQTKVSKAIAAFGSNGITMQVIAGFPSYRLAFERERLEIKARNSVKEGYNANSGGGYGLYDQDYLVSEVFDSLTVIKDSGARDTSSSILWECLCTCGKSSIRSTLYLRNIGVRHKSKASCGCINVAKECLHFITHGRSRTSTYSAWAANKKRCTNPEASDYNSYGGKGIIFCPEWLNSFETFLKDMGDRPKDKLLGRRNKLLGFYKDNCFWGTRLEISCNAINSSNLTCYGETKTITSWSRDIRVKDLGLSRELLSVRKNKLKWDDITTLTSARNTHYGNSIKNQEHHTSS